MTFLQGFEKPFQNKQGFKNISDFISNQLKCIYIGINEQNFELKKKINKQNCLLLFSGTLWTLNNSYSAHKVSVLIYVTSILIKKIISKMTVVGLGTQPKSFIPS